MSIVTTTTRPKSLNNKATVRFSIRLNKDDSVEFRPTATFAHINTKQVLKIIAKADVDITAENNNNKVNFKLTGQDKLFGFLNYFDNDLDDESDDADVQEVIEDVTVALSKVKISDISLPMTAGEADNLIDSL